MPTGSIAGLGGHYVVGLKAVNCNTGEVLAEAQEQAENKEAVLKALDRAAGSLRSRLGESLNSLQRYGHAAVDTNDNLTRGSRAYSLGVKAESAKELSAALPFYKRAVELDPGRHGLPGHVDSLLQPQSSWACSRKRTQGLPPAGEGQ